MNMLSRKTVQREKNEFIHPLPATRPRHNRNSPNSAPSKTITMFVGTLYTFEHVQIVAKRRRRQRQDQTEETRRTLKHKFIVVFLALFTGSICEFECEPFFLFHDVLGKSFHSPSPLFRVGLRLEVVEAQN